MRLEGEWKSGLIKRLENRFPGIQIFKLDTRYKQGSPDLMLLYRDRWAALEAKRHASAAKRPNQQYYIDLLNEMSYAAFIHPGNEEDIIHELQYPFQV